MIQNDPCLSTPFDIVSEEGGGYYSPYFPLLQGYAKGEAGNAILDVDVLKNDYSRFEQKLGMRVGKEVVASGKAVFLILT